MYPTLHNGDYLLACKICYFFTKPQAGQIVILKDPADPSIDFIKRIIATPGQTIRIHDGKVYVDGRQIYEPYINRPWTMLNNFPGNGTHPLVLGPNQYFVMGDNRNYSEDSRSFGPIPRSSILAMAFLRILPISRFGLLGPGPSYVPPHQTSRYLKAIPNKNNLSSLGQL